jgi:hypothetical protein
VQLLMLCAKADIASCCHTVCRVCDNCPNAQLCHSLVLCWICKQLHKLLHVFKSAEAVAHANVFKGGGCNPWQRYPFPRCTLTSCCAALCCAVMHCAVAGPVLSWGPGVGARTAAGAACWAARGASPCTWQQPAAAASANSIPAGVCVCGGGQDH